MHRRTLALSVALTAGVAVAVASGPEGDWRAYGLDPGGRRFSTLARIDRTNVARLRRAWTYHTGDREPVPTSQPTAFERHCGGLTNVKSCSDGLRMKAPPRASAAVSGPPYGRW